LWITSCTVEHGFCTCKLAAQIDLRWLHWNASLMRLTFSSEVCVFQDFTCNRLPVALSLLSQNQMFFHVGDWHPNCVLKLCWRAVRDCSSASHTTHWACSCSVDSVTELTEGHQLVHACKLGMKKTFRVFLSDYINQICV
jgi:hypothetical protein